MIPYKTYPMHEKVQNERHFLIKTEFNLPYYSNRRLIDDNIDIDCEHIEVQKDNIITIKPFKYSVHSTLYSYIVCLHNNEKVIDFGYETPVSLDFISINEIIFEDITESYKREMKINQILQ